MLSKLILDKLIPLPTEEEEMETLRADLARENFPITNLRPGGIFYMLARIMVRIKIELIALAREMLSNMIVSHADKVEWLSVKGTDYGRARKPAVKAAGALTLSRETDTATVRIPKGCIFKTDPDSTGEELRYLSTAEVVLTAGIKTISVPIEAELAGAAYNVPDGKITRCLIHLESITGITNRSDWLELEGSDIEGIESLRGRILNAWDDLAQNPTAGKYKNVCEAVPGVLYVTVDDQHPRGQGTIDIVVTSPTGTASEVLLEQVRTAAHKIEGPYDDILVKASEPVVENIGITVLLPRTLSDEGIAQQAKQAIRAQFTFSRSRALHELYLSDLIVAVKQELPQLKSVRVTCPAADLILSTDKVILPGAVEVTIERG